MNLLSEALAVQNEPFSTTKRTRRVVSTVNDIVHQIFSHVHETNKIISITSSTHDVNINRCNRAFTSIQHLTHAPAPPTPSLIPASTTSAASAFSILAAAATAAAIRTTSFDGVPDTSSTMHQAGRPSSSSWEASAAEAELSTDFIGLSVAATSLADRVRAFTEGDREPPVLEVKVRDEDNGEHWKQQLSPEAAAAVAAASAAEERAQQSGRTVNTVVGKGRVIASTRTDGFLTVELDWTLANDQHAVAYVLESSMMGTC